MKRGRRQVIMSHSGGGYTCATMKVTKSSECVNKSESQKNFLNEECSLKLKNVNP